MTRDWKEGGQAEEGKGVPEGIPLALRLLERDLGARAIDRLWIFPPLVKGRRERGLIAASCFMEDGERRRLHTVSYVAERTGTGLDFQPSLREEGSAPSDRLPRVIAGVVRRSEIDLGEPREFQVKGDPGRFADLLAEYDLPEVSPS